VRVVPCGATLEEPHGEFFRKKRRVTYAHSSMNCQRHVMQRENKKGFGPVKIRKRSGSQLA
jgi:hypothetical protein